MNRSAVCLLAAFLLSCSQPPLTVVSSKNTLLANGYETAVLEINGAASAPQLALIPDHTVASVTAPYRVQNHWEARFQAGVMPGSVRVRVTSRGHFVDQTITLTPQISDSNGDGTPDFARLDDESDREAFRRWMTYLAEAQFFLSQDKRAPEITDCSALVRYAYREALRDHAGTSIRKYVFPHTPLGASILRTRGESYSPTDLTNGTFSEFADARTLQRFNMFLISRDTAQAQPADIFVYRRTTARGSSYHSMVFIGRSRVQPDGDIYVTYHTGPDGTSSGEIRRLTLTQLLHFPDPQWHPIAANPFFLGVYRWNILKTTS